jgi:phosphoglycerate-specific signal transduction histidine kinase
MVESVQKVYRTELSTQIQESYQNLAKLKLKITKIVREYPSEILIMFKRFIRPLLIATVVLLFKIL